MKRSPQPPSARQHAGDHQAPYCVGHRGARAYAPENTLAAFAKAHAMGCRAIELDVHFSRDRELVVHHDDSLTRCTDVLTRFPERRSTMVSDFSLAELKSLDAGRWYVRELALPAAQRQPFLAALTDAGIASCISPDEHRAYASGAIAIPTLRETLELALALDLIVNIEIKTIPRMYAGMTQAVVDLVRALGMQRSVLISSFDHEQLLEVRRLDTSIATGVLTSDRIALPAEYLQLLDADAYHPGCYGDFDSLGFASESGQLDLRGIGQVQGAGKMVFVWTCNSTEHIARLLAAGVTGIITDYPDRFAVATATR